MTVAHPRICLLNPGPVTLTESVRESMLGPDMCHREPAFTDLMNEIRQRLEGIYSDLQSTYSAVLLTGSGTSAVEAMVGTLVPKDRQVLVAANGVYGERIANMLRLQGKSPIEVRQPWIAPLDMVKIENALTSHPDISHVVAVHHETTTGRLNDLDSLGELCTKYETPMLIDAVSSFGGCELPMKRWNAEACAATANKCLHGVPGVAFTLVKNSRLAEGTSHACSLYLDLMTNWNAQSNGYPAFTPAIQSMYALRQALRELDEDGGWRARSETYRKRTEFVLTHLSDSAELLLAEGRSDILTSFRLPPEKSFAELYDMLREDGFVIYAGQKHLMDQIFRLSFMGDLDHEDLERLVVSLRNSLA